MAGRKKLQPLGRLASSSRLPPLPHRAGLPLHLAYVAARGSKPLRRRSAPPLALPSTRKAPHLPGYPVRISSTNLEAGGPQNPWGPRLEYQAEQEEKTKAQIEADAGEGA